MPTTFSPDEPDQMLLLAPDMRDWLPKGTLRITLSDLVDGLDLTAFYAPYEGDGRRNAPCRIDDARGSEMPHPVVEPYSPVIFSRSARNCTDNMSATAEHSVSSSFFARRGPNTSSARAR